MARVTLALLVIACTLAHAHASSSSRSEHGRRDHDRDERSHRHSSHVLAAPQPTTPFGPYTFTNDASTPTPFVSGSYTHYSIPSSSLTPFQTPVLTTPGLLVDLTSSSLNRCSFVFCASHLVRPVEDRNEWSVGVARSGVSDVCEGYFNLTAGSSSPFGYTAMVKPGVKHFAVYARVTDPTPTPTTCDFSVTISGAACPAGFYGSDCGEVPASTWFGGGPTTATLTADPTAATYFEVHPTDIYSTALVVNATSSADNFTIFVHEGDLPNFTQPITPRADFNVTSSGSNPQALAIIPAPAYRVAEQNKRYFLGVTRTPEQVAKTTPTESQITVRVKEQSCPNGYHGERGRTTHRAIFGP
jgi:hypothetical protein